MRLLLSTAILFSLYFTGLTWGQSSTADAYYASESPVAKTNLLANIGPSGSKSQGAKAGIVIASPSTTNPNYLFTWTRDSALVFKVIIDQFTLGLDTSLRSQIDNYVGAQKILQQVSNPSGSINGPALRATALITWANYLNSHGNASYVTGTLWPIIKLDLDYVASSWDQSTFDLWEEVSSSSFFTTAVQHRALREGARLASAIGQSSSSYTTQANNLLCFLQSYWNTAGFVRANTGGGRSGKDANTVLASIHTFDSTAGCDAATFQPCSDKALANLKTYADAFRSIYSINSGIPSNQGIATGRYPEDVYFGGNPWYLTTLAVAEQLYDALIIWKRQNSLQVTSISQPFFSTFVPGIATGTYSSSTSTFTTLTTAIKNFADSFVAVVAKYTPSGGGLAEQYSRSNGVPTSAVDLTWSYAALLTSDMARNSIVPASWGAAGLTVPTSCQGSGGGGAISFTFNVHAETVFGENIFVTGNLNELANWSPDNAIALNANNYPTWSVTINLPASTTFQYKYIRKFNGVTTWESDPNRQVTTPTSGSFVENDTWR
ncbi:carbohydrate-binding module family 20 protein [Amanita thiersii Skay4041]|uniref:glucan 1,4-alpha-glucosidase n=1 Tax=Amanita thiersii Skay4041 TaxID=703135 RepID=A0A2A9NEP7_9AGAR|nr:carbohydrate-binding module family 20 protein [Amanita thiersii Skay4041]